VAAIKAEEIKVREANYGDLPVVVMINRMVLPENYPFSFFEFVLKRSQRYFLVAEVNGKVVGYLMSILESRRSYLVPDPSLAARIDRGETGSHLLSLGVMKGFWGKGVGSSLLREYLRRLEEDGVDFSFLEVRVSNERAIRLYERFGYVKYKVLKAYYMDGEDAYLMVRELRG